MGVGGGESPRREDQRTQLAGAGRGAQPRCMPAPVRLHGDGGGDTDGDESPEPPASRGLDEDGGSSGAVDRAPKRPPVRFRV